MPVFNQATYRKPRCVGGCRRVGGAAQFLGGLRRPLPLEAISAGPTLAGALGSEAILGSGGMVDHTVKVLPVRFSFLPTPPDSEKRKRGGNQSSVAAASMNWIEVLRNLCRARSGKAPVIYEMR
jgi:hypothetical protein